MNYSIHDLEKHFEVRREEAALLFIFLTLLPPGESFTCMNGRVEKLTEETFQLRVDNAVLHKVADGFLSGTTQNEYDEVFSERDGVDGEDD